jgi:hypothetical protein
VTHSVAILHTRRADDLLKIVSNKKNIKKRRFFLKARVDYKKIELFKILYIYRRKIGKETLHISSLPTPHSTV